MGTDGCAKRHRHARGIPDPIGDHLPGSHGSHGMPRHGATANRQRAPAEACLQTPAFKTLMMPWSWFTHRPAPLLLRGKRYILFSPSFRPDGRQARPMFTACGELVNTSTAWLRELTRVGRPGRRWSPVLRASCRPGSFRRMGTELPDGRTRGVCPGTHPESHPGACDPSGSILQP